MTFKKDLTPQFETEEKEAEYWDTHSPLDLAAKPKPQRVRLSGSKNRPITIRLDSESRSKLDKLADKQGLGPSTFARLILMSVIEQAEKVPKRLTLDDLIDVLDKNLPQSLKDQAESLAKAISIGDPENPALLVIDRPQMKDWEALVLKFISALLTAVGVQVITPEDSKYEKLKSIAAGKKQG